MQFEKDAKRTGMINLVSGTGLLLVLAAIEFSSYIVDIRILSVNFNTLE